MINSHHSALLAETVTSF